MSFPFWTYIFNKPFLNNPGLGFILGFSWVGILQLLRKKVTDHAENIIGQNLSEDENGGDPWVGYEFYIKSAWPTCQ